MRRRDFITFLGGAAAWPLAARAELAANEAAMPTIGFLGPGSAAGFVPLVEGFRQGLGAAWTPLQVIAILRRARRPELQPRKKGWHPTKPIS